MTTNVDKKKFLTHLQSEMDRHTLVAHDENQPSETRRVAGSWWAAYRKIRDLVEEGEFDENS